MAPVDRRGQGLLAGHHRAGAAGEEPEAVVELGGDALGGQLPAAGGGQLDGERDAVEAVADLGDGGGVGVADGERRSGPAGPLDEQGDGVVLRQRRDVDGVARGSGSAATGTRQVISPGHAEGLAAGGQHRRGRIGRQQSGDELGAGGDEVLAVVQDEQRRLVAELGRELVGGGDAGHLAGAEGGQRGATDGVRIGERRQLDPPHAAGLRVDGLGGDGQGEAGLADPGRTGQRHQPLACQQAAHVGDLAGPPDQRRELDRQVVAERVERPQRRERRRQVRVDELPDVLGASEVLEAVQAEIDQRRPGREAVGDQRRGRRRHQHLTAVPDRRIRAQRLSA